MAETEMYIYLWSYRIDPDKVDEFLMMYGSDGAWVDLFSHADGYLGTQLLQDRDDASRFVTIDRWESEVAFRGFRETFAAEFEQLDREGEALTVGEAELGRFRPTG